MPGKTRRNDRRRGQVRRSHTWLYLTVAAVAVAAAIGAGALAWSRGSGSDSGGQVILPSPGLPGLSLNGRVLGRPDAPVSIVEYADFQ